MNETQPIKGEKRATIVIPTYNEEENIGRLIDILFKEVFPKIDSWVIDIVVVDGRSKDMTVSIVEEKKKIHSGLHLIVEEEKGGLGAAYLKGFSYAIGVLHTDAVIEFDADFQHSPDAIPELLSKLDHGYDYVVGSRNIEGGRESESRDRIRSLLTRFGGFLARAILFFPGRYYAKVTDPTTGLKATRVAGILDKESAKERRLYSRKFGYKVQLLSETIRSGARYAEIPLVFEDRAGGTSKFEPGTAVEVLWACIKTRLHDEETARFIRFGIVGSIGYVINALFLAILPHYIGIEPFVWALATEAAIISNFTLNNVWTFRKEQVKGNAKIMSKFLHFNATSAGALVIQTVLGSVAVWMFGPEYRQLILPVTTLLAVVPYNWHMYRKYIWKTI